MKCKTSTSIINVAMRRSAIPLFQYCQVAGAFIQHSMEKPHINQIGLIYSYLGSSEKSKNNIISGMQGLACFILNHSVPKWRWQYFQVTKNSRNRCPRRTASKHEFLVLGAGFHKSLAQSPTSFLLWFDGSTVLQNSLAASMNSKDSRKIQ